MADGPGSSDRRTTGSDERERTVRLAVPEMDCPSCAGKVDSGLERLDGVTDAALDPMSGTATVTYDPERADEAAVIAAVEAVGYEVVRGGRLSGNEGESDGPNNG